LNALQKRSGYEVTPMIAGKVPFGKLKKERDISAIQEELRSRNLSTEGGWQKDLIPRLKNDEKDNNTFFPKDPLATWEHIYDT
jgi:DNA topoisomerase VI subunit A